MKQRYIRILIYEGSPEWIANAQAERGVKGSMTTKGGIIREAVVGDFLEVLDDQKTNEEQA
jgi:hypothetical protein